MAAPRRPVGDRLVLSPHVRALVWMGLRRPLELTGIEQHAKREKA